MNTTEHTDSDIKHRCMDELSNVLLKFSIYVSAMIVTFFIFTIYPIDIFVSSFFYSKTFPHWTYSDYWLWNYIDHHAVYLVWGILGLQIVLLVMNYHTKDKLWYQKFLLTHVIVLAIGPGLLINVVMKHAYHRARPREIQEFHGDLHYTPPFIRGESYSNNPSFPSGHAAIGFIMLLPGMSVQNRKLGIILLISGYLWGSLVGVSRIIQGGHFLSDVILSAYIVIGLTWFTDKALGYYLRAINKNV